VSGLASSVLCALLLALVFSLACAAAPKHSSATSAQQRYRRLFDRSFPNPRISKASTTIPGLEIWRVVDESAANEDPLFAQAWLSTRGHIFPATPQGVQEAMTTLMFVPTSAKQAIEAATLPFLDEGYTIATHARSPDISLPPRYAKDLTTPVAIPIQGGYRVLIVVFFVDPLMAFHKQEPGRTLSKIEVEIRPGRYHLRETILWDSTSTAIP